MFRMRLDYTFYTKDVVLEDKILNMEKRNIDELQLHWGMLSTAGLVGFPHIHMEVCSHRHPSHKQFCIAGVG